MVKVQVPTIGGQPGDVHDEEDGQLRFTRQRPPITASDWDELKLWSADALRSAGLVRWDHAGPDGYALWLFPAPWFYAIPDGLEVTSIMGNSGPWVAAAASTDQRAGCSAYGFRIRHRVAT